MIQLYLNIFGLIVDLNVAIPKCRKPKNVDKTPINDNINTITAPLQDIVDDDEEELF